MEIKIKYVKGQDYECSYISKGGHNQCLEKAIILIEPTFAGLCKEHLSLFAEKLNEAEKEIEMDNGSVKEEDK